MTAFERWKHNVLVAIDQALGALAPRSLPGETISARAATARAHGHRWGCWLCRVLDWIEEGHCAAAIANDRRRAREVLDDLDGYG